MDFIDKTILITVLTIAAGYALTWSFVEGKETGMCKGSCTIQSMRYVPLSSGPDHCWCWKDDNTKIRTEPIVKAGPL
jgi:hypothetical protein